MSDDLVKRYSSYNIMMLGDSGNEVSTPDGEWVKYKDYKAQADRIEELEAKLAKAVWDMKALIDVSTLMQSSSTHNRFRHNTIVTDSIWAQWSKQLKSARSTIAAVSETHKLKV